MPGKPSEGGDWVTLLNNVFEQLVRFERDYGWKATVILIVIALILIRGGFIAAWGLQEWSKKSLQKELSLLRSAESVDTDLRARRHETYSRLWNLTRLLTAWPEKIPTYCELSKLSQDMCDWYYNNNFDGGGMYLSTGAMAHYRMAQAALAVFDNVKSNEALHNQESKDLRQYLSGLRTELTKDLLSRHGPFERDIGKLKRKHEDQTGVIRRSGRLVQLTAIGDLKITEEKEDPFVKIEFPGKKALSSVVNVDEATKIIAALVKACRYAKSDADRTPTKLLDDSAVKNLNENKNKSPKRRIDTIDARAVLNAAEWPKGGQQRGNPPSAALP